MAEAGKRQAGRSTGFGQGLPVNQGLLIAAFVGMIVLTLLGPFMTFNNPSISGSGSPTRQALYALAFVAAIAGLRPWVDPGRLLAVPLPLVIALAWCIVSLFWAIDPGIAVRRLLLTLVIVWTTFAVVPRLGYDRTVLVLRVLLVIALVANYLAVLGWPAVGLHQNDETYDLNLVGEWRGVMQHKNIAGAACAFAIIAFAFDRRRMPRALRLGVIALAAYFLWRSGSRTSAGVCVGALAAGLLFLRYQARNRLLVLAITCFAAIAGGIFLNIYNDPLLRHTQDPTAFTGRTLIWQALGQYAGDAPMGSGYGSFWNIGPDSPIFHYATGWVTGVAEGHNGFMDLLVTIGLPGLILVVVTIVIWPLVRLFGSRQANGPRGALILAMIVFCVAHNSTESSLLDRDTLVNVFLMIGLALLWTVTDRDGSARGLGGGSGGVRRPLGATLAAR